MDARLMEEIARAQEAFSPVERIEGSLDAGALVICDHASNAFPPGYGALGLRPEALQRHIAYDIGTAWLVRRLAQRLSAPAILSTFSRLLIDPNRGADDPTLVMRYSDGAVIPGNARIEATEIERRRKLFWAPYRSAIDREIHAMMDNGTPPALISIHSFTPVWRGRPRPWKVGVLWDADPRLPAALLREFRAQPDLAPEEIGDNEPYDGALMGDTVDATATRRGLSNALIEIRQDLIASREDSEAWADRLADILAPLIAPTESRAPRDYGSRARGAVRSPPIPAGAA